MLLTKTLEYLFYLALFAFMCKYATAASVQSTEAPAVATETLRKPQKAESLLSGCETSSFSWMCLKIEFVKIMEKLAEQEELNVLPGVSVVKDENAKELKTSELMAGRFCKDKYTNTFGTFNDFWYLEHNFLRLLSH